MSNQNSEKLPHPKFYGSKLFLKFFFWVWLTLILTGITAGLYAYFYHFEPEKQRFFDMGRQIIEENGRILVNAYEKLGPESASYLRLPGSFWLYDADLKNILSRIAHKHGGPKMRPGMPGAAPEDFARPPREFEPTVTSQRMPPQPSEDVRSSDESEPPKMAMGFPPPDETGLPAWTEPGNPRPAMQKQEMPPWERNFDQLFKEKESEIKQLATRLLAGHKILSESVGGEILLGAAIKSDSGNNYAIVCHIPSPAPMHARFIIYRVIENLPVFLLSTGLLCFMLARYIIKPLIDLRTASRSFAMGDLKTRISGPTLTRFDEISDLASDFNEMSEKIEKMISSQRRLFNDISHELRSPLARLQISLELLQRKSPDADQAMLTRIGREISRMNALIEELLQFSKLESNEISSTPEKFQLPEVLAHICNDANFEGKARNCLVKLYTPEQLEITGIPQLIERAVENILRNALRHSPDNSEIRVELQKLDNTAVLTICDHGSGIPEAELQKVFSPFYCLSEERNPQKGGIGLGLAIAQRAVKLHHGQITLKNNPEGGLTATVTLPLDAKA